MGTEPLVSPQDTSQEPGRESTAGASAEAAPALGRRGLRDEDRHGRARQGREDAPHPHVPELAEVLERIPRAVSSNGEPSPWVFNNPDTATRWVDIKKQWARTLRISAIREFRFHDLRHTFASRVAQRGASPKAIQDLLGHADLKMTMRYAHLAQNDLRDAVSVLSGARGSGIAQSQKRRKAMGHSEPKPVKARSAS